MFGKTDDTILRFPYFLVKKICDIHIIHRINVGRQCVVEMPDIRKIEEKNNHAFSVKKFCYKMPDKVITVKELKKNDDMILKLSRECVYYSQNFIPQLQELFRSVDFDRFSTIYFRVIEYGLEIRKVDFRQVRKRHHEFMSKTGSISKYF